MKKDKDAGDAASPAGPPASAAFRKWFILNRLPVFLCRPGGAAACRPVAGRSGEGRGSRPGAQAGMGHSSPIGARGRLRGVARQPAIEVWIRQTADTGIRQVSAPPHPGGWRFPLCPREHEPSAGIEPREDCEICVAAIPIRAELE